jgi:hypothetical protein
MEDHDAKRHPGPWRVMQVDSEFAGSLVAVGSLVLGLVSTPVATGFVLGSIALGVVVALLLRFTPKKFSRVVLGIVIILAAGVLWWLSASLEPTELANVAAPEIVQFFADAERPTKQQELFIAQSLHVGGGSKVERERERPPSRSRFVDSVFL